MTYRIVSRLDADLFSGRTRRAAEIKPKSTLKACSWHHYNDHHSRIFSGSLLGQGVFRPTDTGTVKEEEKKNLLLLMSHVQSNSALRTPN